MTQKKTTLLAGRSLLETRIKCALHIIYNYWYLISEKKEPGAPALNGTLGRESVSKRRHTGQLLAEE